MLEEVKRKEVDKRDKQLPQSFEQLIQMYDLDRIWTYMSQIVDFANKDEPKDIENLNNKIDDLQEELIISEDKTISVSAVANQYKYAEESITVPAGYKLLSASIIDNGYISQEIASIINLTNSRVVVNVYGAKTRTVNVKVRILYIKNN